MAYQLVFPELAEALRLALKEDGFYKAMEDSVSGEQADKHQAMLAYMDYSIVEAKEFGRCFIPEQHYGVSIWSFPLDKEKESLKTEQKRQFISKQMGASSLNAYQSMCDYMAAQSRSVIADDSWYLSIIGILPDFQGQGLGPGLLEGTLSELDQTGTGCYLETFTPRNMTFYQRLGFEVVAEFDEPFSHSKYWIMQRLPK
ncbi:GNAT family N-acetyltransferase [Aliikangiella marina]|uniref:GNAT family N-acetyltransferase n=1 Tax=Aliikangiella marina TaxID=1712262 RepID=A0A545T593_9GAMM|nr:GNAT family N-acetyltransferase [Aliikangiella marina]TQV72342.1 GNAT family N-acetyltransferase [Aliikangiella marina]